MKNLLKYILIFSLYAIGLFIVFVVADFLARFLMSFLTLEFWNIPY